MCVRDARLREVIRRERTRVGAGVSGDGNTARGAIAAAQPKAGLQVMQHNEHARESESSNTMTCKRKPIELNAEIAFETGNG